MSNKTKEKTETTHFNDETILSIDQNTSWVKFFKDTAYKVAFRAEKIKDENDRLIYLGRFFQSFVYVLANVEEPDNTTGSRLAVKLLKISIADTDKCILKRKKAGFEGKRKNLEKAIKEHPNRSEELMPILRETEKEIEALETALEDIERTEQE